MADKNFTAQEWDEIRVAFHTSIMVDTSLRSLAQNLDTADWPLTGADETPSKYIDLTYAELAADPAFDGQPERINHLIGILRDTMAFDNPFGDMVQQTEAAEEKDNQLLKNMAKLEIPVDFPIGLTELSVETLEFCQRENLGTIGKFAVFSQGMSQAIIVSGEFRKLLNAIANIDEAVLAEILPFRVGGKGLHLPEALAHAIQPAAPAIRFALLRKFGCKLSADEKAAADGVQPSELNAAEAAIQARAAQFFEWFGPELAELKSQIGQGGSLDRYIMVLNEPVTESLATALLQSRIAPPAAVAQPGAQKKKGFFARLFGAK